MKVYSGSSNQQIAAEIAKKLKAKQGQIELSSFANNEVRVWINEKEANAKAIVVQSFSNPPDKHIIEFCLICDALKRLGTRKIIAVIPWMGYCIQDKVFRKGEPLSSKVIARIIQSAKVNHVITLDLHNQTIEGFFDIPFTEMFTTYPIIEYLKKKKLAIDLVISPDMGAIKKSTLFAQALSVPLATINKKRDLDSGKVTIIGTDGEVEGKRALITDDFISTGGTLIQTANFLKKQGVKKIFACLAHHFYINGVQEKIEASAIDILFATNTIQKPDEKKYKKLDIIDISGHIAKKIKAIL